MNKTMFGASALFLLATSGCASFGEGEQKVSNLADAGVDKLFPLPTEEQAQADYSAAVEACEARNDKLNAWNTPIVLSCGISGMLAGVVTGLPAAAAMGSGLSALACDQALEGNIIDDCAAAMRFDPEQEPLVQLP